MDAIYILRQQQEQQQYQELLKLEMCYSALWKAYSSENRDMMLRSISYYQNLFPLNIVEIRGQIINEFVSRGFSQPIFSPFLTPTDYEVKLNILGCIKAIDNHVNQLNYYKIHYTYATQTLFETRQLFTSQQILLQEDKGVLKVSDLLSVLKYAIKVAQAIDPENENFDKANAAITAFQGIDAVLNNKPEDKPVNKMLHLANDFLTSAVKESAEKKETKGEILVVSLLVDLAIDFFCKK